jgi:hypothetical protein
MEIILGIMIGMALAGALIYLYINRLVRQVVAELNEQIEHAESSLLPVIVERHNGEIFCYEETERQFICQGATLDDIRTAMKVRFPEKTAYLAGGDEELVKELREELTKSKIEGMLVTAKDANAKVD